MWSEIRGYPLQAFSVCVIAYMFTQVDLALFAYALPAIREDFAVSLKTMGWVIAGAYTLGGILQVWMGHLTDRVGRKFMLQFSTVTSSLFIAAHAFAPHLAILAVLRGCAIATGGAMYPVTGAVVTEEAPARYRGIMNGLLQTGYPIGWFVASLFAAPLLVLFGWRVLFLVGFLSIPYVFVIRRYLNETGRFAAEKAQRLTLDSRPPVTVRELFAPGMRDRTILLFVAQYLFVIAYGGSSFFFPTYFVEARGIALDSTAYLVGIGNAIGVLGYILAAYVGEFYITRRTTVVIWTIIGATAFLVLVWGTSGFWDTMVMFAVMSMFFYGTAAVKFAYVAEIFPTRLRATGLALCSSLAVNLGIATGPLLVSYGVEALGWNLAFSTVVAVPMILAALLYLKLTPLPSGLEVEDIEGRLNSTSGIVNGNKT